MTADPSLIERLRRTETQHRVTMLGHVYDDVPVNPDGPEAASTLEDQARLIDELTAELAASTTALERSTAAAQKVLRYIRASSEIGAAGWPIVDELDALLTKLNSFGEQA